MQTANKPIRYTDPDGLIIQTEGFGPFDHSYSSAVRYLSSSPTARTIVEALRSSSRITTIEKSQIDTNTPFFYGSRVFWNPGKTLTVASSGKTMSAAMCLAHELAQVYAYHYDKKYQGMFSELSAIQARADQLQIEANRLLMANPLSPDYTSKVEERDDIQALVNGLRAEASSLVQEMEEYIVDEYERPIAKELNQAGNDEGERLDYNDWE